MKWVYVGWGILVGILALGCARDLEVAKAVEELNKPLPPKQASVEPAPEQNFQPLDVPPSHEEIAVTMGKASTAFGEAVWMGDMASANVEIKRRRWAFEQAVSYTAAAQVKAEETTDALPYVHVKVDRFTGEKSTWLLNSYLGDEDMIHESHETSEIFFSMARIKGMTAFVIRIDGHDDWYFLNKLHLLVDGRPIPNLAGSRETKVQGQYGLQETLIVPLKPAHLRQLARAKGVEFKVVGRDGYIEAKLGPSTMYGLKAFFKKVGLRR